MLHQVAYHLALKAHAAAVRRRVHERHVVDRPEPDPLATITGRELRVALDAELARLPENYRSALLLCSLEGKTRDEAARRVLEMLAGGRRRPGSRRRPGPPWSAAPGGPARGLTGDPTGEQARAPCFQ
jgi:hypothetical protein